MSAARALPCRRSAPLTALCLVLGAIAGVPAARAEELPGERPALLPGGELAPRVFITGYFGHLGSARLQLPHAELDGDALHGFGAGVRLEVPLHRYLASGVALQLGGETGADLRQAGGFASAGGDTDYMILLKPRLPLFAGRHELSAIALGGLSARRHLRGGVPWPQGDGSSEARSVKADATTWAPFFALGLGFTTWLDTHWGAFVELTVLRRHTDGRIREDDFDFVPASLLDRSWYAFELEETSARLVFGFGYAMGVP